MKLHLGCGEKFIPGWTHIDVCDYPHIAIRHSVDSLPMITDSSVEVIYACHVLEHFLRRDVVRVLREWNRVLCAGGVLRVAVPDFAALAVNYLEHREMGNIHGPLMGRGDQLYNIHHTAFDEATLTAALVEAGFRDIRRYDWRKTEHADLDDFSQSYYPHMNKESGHLLSLNMEATA